MNLGFHFRVLSISDTSIKKSHRIRNILIKHLHNYDMGIECEHQSNFPKFLFFCYSKHISSVTIYSQQQLV